MSSVYFEDNLGVCMCSVILFSACPTGTQTWSFSLLSDRPDDESCQT